MLPCLVFVFWYVFCIDSIICKCNCRRPFALIDRFDNVSVVPNQSNEKDVANRPNNEDHGRVIVCLKYPS